MDTPESPRKPWRAGLLSLLLPGLGQLYNGQGKKGVVFYCLVYVAPFALLPLILGLPLAPVNIIIPTLVFLCLYVYVLVDAIRIARRLGATYQRKVYNKWYVYLGAIAMAGYVVQPALALLMQGKLAQAYKIPAASMRQTLLPGDHILVNKLLYHGATPQQFDVIAFTYPWEESHDFIKRVVALPGDQVEVRTRHVYVNGRRVDEPYVRQTAYRHAQDFGPVMVPKQGDTVEIRADQRLYLNGTPLSIPLGTFFPREFGPQLTGFEVFYGPLFPAGTTLKHPTGPLRVDDDYYFTLGDNRANSKDSRYWGFVRRDQIKGKASVVYWSWDRRAHRVRWERIGRRIE